MYKIKDNKKRSTVMRYIKQIVKQKTGITADGVLKVPKEYGMFVCS